MKKTTLMSTTIASLMATGLAAGTDVAEARNKTKTVEKCYGVALKHLNDCGIKNGHGCHNAKENSKSFDEKEWLNVKRGTCENIQKALKMPGVKDYVEKVAKRSKGKK